MLLHLSTAVIHIQDDNFSIISKPEKFGGWELMNMNKVKHDLYKYIPEV